MDLAYVATVLACAPADIVKVSGAEVTLKDGAVHTFADPARVGLEDYEAPAAKPAKSVD